MYTSCGDNRVVPCSPALLTERLTTCTCVSLCTNCPHFFPVAIFCNDGKELNRFCVRLGGSIHKCLAAWPLLLAGITSGVRAKIEVILRLNANASFSITRQTTLQAGTVCSLSSISLLRRVVRMSQNRTGQGSKEAHQLSVQSLAYRGADRCLCSQWTWEETSPAEFPLGRSLPSSLWGTLDAVSTPYPSPSQRVGLHISAWEHRCQTSQQNPEFIVHGREDMSQAGEKKHHLA